MKNIILIGFMGSGKTTVGTGLAQEPDYLFLDTDACIEENEQRSINRIFAEDGEAYFRKAETELLKELLQCSRSKTILSTGGGMPLRPENAELLKQLGHVVYLKTGTATVYERLKEKTDRPLLQGDNVLGTIQTLLNAREPLYASCADVTVVTDGKTPEEIVQEIWRTI